MNEIRRFLRYTLPGIACVFQLLLALVIVDYIKLEDFRISGDKSIEIIGAIFGAFLLSGGLGFILAQIYWGLYWFGPICDLIAIDHRPLLYNLIEKYKGRFLIKNINGDPIKIFDLSIRDAWIISTYHFESKHEKSGNSSNMDNMTNRLVDVTHSLGATLVGSIFAVISWVLIIFNSSTNIILAHYIFWCWGIVIVIMAIAYRSSLKAHQRLAEMKFTNDIICKLRKRNELTLYYPFDI